MTPKVDIILLAAGRSSRMNGGDKTLETVRGVPLLRHLALECMASCASRTHVIVTPDKPMRAKAVSDLDLNIVHAHEAHLGMSASLKAGINAAQDADALLILLADMPQITKDHLNALIRASGPEGTGIIRAASQKGRPGHPVLFANGYFEALSALSGDKGAKEILLAHADDVTVIPLDGDAALIDLDTPEAWAAWRKSQK
jgi:molybdenum cofactor cytidylyltransferase